MDEPGDRINVSREALRAELSQLELRIVDRLTTALEKKADHVALEALEGRVQALELTRASREHLATDITELYRDVTDLKRFRYAVPSTAILGLLTALATLGYSLIH